MYSDNGNIGHLHDDDCHRGCRRIIAELEERRWELNRIGRVLVEESDQNGTWLRVAQIRSIRPTPEGLEITVS